MKEVIFHFFPSARFLGLSLKILFHKNKFHKNKEIKRMLSNKWTFSLMSLITLLAFAFVTVPVIAVDDFDAALSVDDISHLADSQSQRGTDITVTLAFGEKVGLVAAQAAKISVRVEDMNGNETVTEITGVAVITPKDIDPAMGGDQFNGKTYMFDIPSASTPEGSKKVYLFIPKGVKIIDPGVDKSSKDGALTINLVGSEPVDSSVPDVVKIAAMPALVVPDAGYAGGAFDVVITLSEQPKENKFTVDHLAVDKGTAAAPVYLGAIDPIDGKDAQTEPDPPTGPDVMHHEYLVTITPKAEDGDLVVKVKEFEDNLKGIQSTINGDSGVVAASANKYMPPVAYSEGYDKLTVKINLLSAAALIGGFEAKIGNETRIPGGGYLVVATNVGESGVKDNPENDKDEPKASARTPAQLLYNAVAVGLPNLETFLGNGGTIDLISPTAGLLISEIMWGSDASLAATKNSQWIEIHNPGASLLTGDGTTKFVFYSPNETLPDMSVAANNIQDRVGTIGAGGYWSLAGKGQSGRSGEGEDADTLAAVVPTQAIISMQRVIDAAGVAADGTMASSWAQSTPPGLNFDPAKVGVRVGSPGAVPIAYPVAPVVVPPAAAVAVAMPADIMITEIMVDTGGGRLPQWIELTNVSGAEVSVAGWSLEITNSDADDDVVGGSVSLSLSGTLGVGGGEDAGGTMGKSLLLVAGNARSSSNLVGSARVVDISDQVDQRGRYTLISTMAFMAALIPPQTTGILTYGDTAGNLDEGWELPTSEGGRSSLIRREADALGTATLGTAANGWVLASSTSLVSGPATWYGSDEDAGTPGYDSGGPLPVQLSHFRPARDKDTGAAVITWSTQSELNNAGFFIKRSQQRDGQFKVINAAMIQGAGTTSEKQFYIYTDTTAQPNVVYYYQIEDVSLDGNHQTLTNGIRLKGHIGAAGKLTTTWGDLKTSQ